MQGVCMVCGVGLKVWSSGRRENMMYFEFSSFNIAIIKGDVCNQASSSTQARKKVSVLTQVF